ncbi:MAG: flagellar filament capping protein FliD [Oscillospiraceae bacterium]|nr:flagellar filament capping protein FliD [Oscillospiraceae bacterium]
MTNPLGRSNPVRMMGMASGMDTDFIIQQSMRVHQMRIDNQMRSRTLLQWRADTHTEIRNELNAFRTRFLTSQGAGLLNRNNFNAVSATAVGDNASAVTVRGLGGTTPRASITIGRIESLATSASVRTSNEGIRNFFRGAEGSGNPLNREVRGTDRFDSFGAHVTTLGFRAQDDAARTANLTVGNRNVSVTQGVVNNDIEWQERFSNTFSFGTTGVAPELQGLSMTVTRGDDNSLTFVATRGTEGEDDFVRITGTLTFDPADADGGRVGANVTFDEVYVGDGVSHDEADILAELESDLAEHLTMGVTPDPDDPDAVGTLNGVVRLENQTLTFTRTGTLEADADTGRPRLTFEQIEGNETVHHNGRALEFFDTQTIRINNTDITLRSNMTVNQAMTAINNSNAGVRATFEPLTGRFNLEATGTGSSSTIDLRGGSGNINDIFFSALGFEPQDDSMLFRGANAVVYLDGDRVESQSNTINFGGVAITLNRTTYEEGQTFNEGRDSIVVNTGRDTAAVVDMIREFVVAYNSIIERIERLTRERQAPHERSYRPLTPEEMAHMNDREIEQWETIARRGMMARDSALTDLSTRLRRELFTAVEQAGLTPHDIGMTTGSFFGGTGGQIVLDEDRLTAALERDPEQVANVFAAIDGNTGTGWLWRMSNIMNDYTSAGGSGSRAIRNLEASIRRTNEQMDRMQARMFAEEDRLFRQFAAMETAMSRLQNQGEWFGAMLGGFQQGR